MAHIIRRITLGVNSYLIAAACGYVLVDTGFPARRDKLDAALAAAGCGPGELRLIVLTHRDVDHADIGAHLCRTHGAPIAIHRDDAEMVRRGDMSVGRKDRPDRQTFVFRSMVRIVGLWSKVTGGGEDFEAFEPDVLLEDGQDLAGYGLNARVVLLAGHSRGSIGILTGDGDLFCGDLLANYWRPGLHFYIDDMGRANESLGKLRSLGVRTVFPGHGNPFPLAQLPG